MNSLQQSLVRTSFAKVAPIADTAATIFYEDLFRRDPELRRLFASDLTEQRKKLMQMLATAVAQLGDWDKFAPAVRALGQRHRGYGVTSADYGTVRDALMATLEQGLGAEFSPEVRDAWDACIAAIAGEMLAEDAVTAKPALSQ